MTVAVIGDSNVDLEILLPATGVEGNEHAHSDPTLSGGGSAANAAAALSRLGVTTRFVGTVGSDVYGAAAIASLADAGVDTSGVRMVDGGTTVMVLVVVPIGGERLIYVWPPRGGAHLELGVDDAVDGVEGASWLHVSGIALRGEPAAGSILTVMDAARSSGAVVSLDVNLRLENWGWESDFRPTIDQALQRSDVVFGGAVDELCPLSDVGDPVQAVTGLATTRRLVVGRLGAGGAVAHDGDRLYRAEGHQVEVVDTVGAGDAFDAGFIASRMRGESIEMALRYANGTAALSIGRPGARATPSHEEVVAFIGGEGQTAACC